MEASILYSQQEISSYLSIYPKGILHVGAHLAEEATAYQEFLSKSLGKTYWIESQPDKCQEIRRQLNPERNVVIEATIWNETGVEMTFHETTNSESSSLLDLAIHKEVYPDISIANERVITTQRLDDIPDLESAIFDFVNVDLQGVELRALQSLGSYLDQINWIYAEVNKIELYRDCNLVDELDAFLNNHGFIRVSTRWIWGGGWGDAIYFRIGFISPKLRAGAQFLALKWVYKNISVKVRAAIPNSFKNILRRYI